MLGRSRSDAITRLVDYLKRVKIHGVSTNLALSRAILQDASFKKGGFSTGYLPDFFKRIDSKKILREALNDSGELYKSLVKKAIKLEGSNELKVLSPQMGGFYRAPSQDEEPFVSEGQIIDVNQVLCLIESMKVFTELTLADYKSIDGKALFPDDVKYKVIKIIAEDKNTVNQGDLLFVMLPEVI